MTRSIFVIGTDTGVGKTTIAVGILARERARGHAVAALKPAETGCTVDEDGTLRPADGLRLREACGLPHRPIADFVPHRYASPVAPAVAARREGPFELGAVLRARDALLTDAPSLLLIEGAGGLLVPFSDTFLAADVASALEAPLLIVARASLGTINHTLLTIAEARRRNLSILGVVLNRVVATHGPDEPSDLGNAAEIERWGKVRVFGTVPHCATDTHSLAAAVGNALGPLLA